MKIGRMVRCAAVVGLFVMLAASGAVAVVGRPAVPAQGGGIGLADFIVAWRLFWAGDPSWDRAADLVADGRIDRLDAVRAVETFVKQSPAPRILENLFFLHHSTGEGFVVEGRMREHIAQFNADHGTHFELWDHEYNGQGLRDPQGRLVGRSYEIPGDNTDPDGLHALWTSSDPEWAHSRQLIMENHEVVAFKSCFPASAIEDDAMLERYKRWYLEMRGFFDAHREKLFVVMSTPPLHRLSTTREQAARARAFANWLKSDEYLAGHPNVVCFDLFDMLANPDDGSAEANMLRREYESDPGGDSHPNVVANRIVGAALARFLCEAALGYRAP